MRCDTTVVAPASSEKGRRAGAGPVCGVRWASGRARSLGARAGLRRALGQGRTCWSARARDGRSQFFTRPKFAFDTACCQLLFFLHQDLLKKGEIPLNPLSLCEMQTPEGTPMLFCEDVCMYVCIMSLKYGHHFSYGSTLSGIKGIDKFRG